MSATTPAAPQPTPSCDTCKFFGPLTDPVGICRARAPRAELLPRGITPTDPAQLATWGAAVWPMVTSADWCGEWARA